MKKILLFFTVILAAMSIHAQTLLDTAVNFTVKDTEGNNHELFEILNNNQIVVIDFFSTT
jgi:hypothetical protein